MTEPRKYELVEDDTEVWRAIDGAYEVSSLGRVRRIATGKVLRTVADAWGYPRVNLYSEGHYVTTSVHRLVCRAFHGEAPSDNHQVAHCDGDPSNAAASNLRWATPKENCADRLLHGKWSPARGERHGNAKLTDKQVGVIVGAPNQKGVTIRLAREFDVHPSTISRIRRGELRAAEARKDFAPADQPAAEAVEA